MTKTVVLIHGAWQVPASWDRFKSRFEAAGYTVIAPAWPLMDRPVAELNANPDPKFGSLTVGAIVDHYDSIIRALPEKPLILGHSFGGLIAQLLLDRGLGSAGVALDPAPIGGLIPGPKPLSAAFPVLARLNGWSRPFTLSKAAYDKGFANTAPKAQRDEEYAKYVVPAPGRIFFQAALNIGTWVSPKKRTQPLLIVVGEKDNTVTPNLARQAFNRQKGSKALTDFHEFAGRSHYLANEPGWEEVADYAIEWAGRNA